MHARSLMLRQGARWSLCVAALLSFMGAAVGPSTHIHVGDPVRVAALVDGNASGPSETDPSQPAPHNELGCFVCQTLTTPGAPASGSSVQATESIVSVPIHDTPRFFTSVHSATPQARAPPAV